MKCDKCNKKATVHLTEIVDGKAMEMHMCEECAREQSAQMEQQFGLADLLAGLTDFGKQVPDINKEAAQCSACGLTYEDFRKFGRFGCAQCYVAFRPQLQNLLKKIHGSHVHLGKKPLHLVDPHFPAQTLVKAATNAEEPVVSAQSETVESLRAEMHRAIEDEDFERAAQLRDRIHQLEKESS